MTRKTKLFIILPFSFITAFIVTAVALIRINMFFEGNRLKFNLPVTIKLMKPVEIHKREPQVIRETTIISYPEEIDTPIEKYICDKFEKDYMCRVALAIVKAESNFNELAIHANDNSTVDLGCWQINFPTHKETISPVDAFDCYKATDWAYAKYKRDGDSFSAWSVFNNGSFKNHL